MYYDSQDIYDYVIFYAGSDRPEVVQFIKEFESKYGLRGITYDDHTEECPYIPSEFSRTSFLLKRSVFIFFYFTESLLDPDLEEQTALNRDEALMLTLKDPLKRSTLIPIFPKHLSNVNLPYGFNGLRGFRMFDKYHANAVKNTFLTERFREMKKVLKQKLAAEREEWIKRSKTSKKEEPRKIKRSSSKVSMNTVKQVNFFGTFISQKNYYFGFPLFYIFPARTRLPHDTNKNGWRFHF